MICPAVVLVVMLMLTMIVMFPLHCFLPVQDKSKCVYLFD